MSILCNPVAVSKSASRGVLSLVTATQVVYLVCELLFWLLGRRPKGKSMNLSEVKRVLVLRLDQIGDVVMSTPFLRELRRNLPATWITLVVRPSTYNLVELCPYVNEVLTYDWNTYGTSWQVRRHFRALKLAWGHFWRRGIDLAIWPRWDADYYNGTFLAYLSGATVRVGYSERVIENKLEINRGFDQLFTHVLDGNGLKHEVERNLDVIHFLGGSVKEDRLELWIDKDDEGFADNVLKFQIRNPNDLLIAFGPGASAPKRKWPIGNYVEIGAWLNRQYGARILVVGGKEEEELGREFKHRMGDMVINMVGEASLRQTIALIKRCRLYVGNDAGPMHLAAGMNIPVVELSCHPLKGSLLHPNSPRRFEPWRVLHVILQPEKSLEPCCESCNASYSHCIRGIKVDKVKEAVRKLMAWPNALVRPKDFIKNGIGSYPNQ